MRKNAFLDRILYIKKYVEDVEKDGKIYKKYAKEKRFKINNNIIAVFIGLLIVVVAAILAFLVNQKPSKELPLGISSPKK